ncbi:hypothetical protein [Halomonas urumqiensis]|uniref:Uncharacterized protein n=1 Tax=Halomonas urumqiensis TaxID=1684789 RepID=A0A2N7UK32_9GAMM|nr:hypothetical protein [Halomonas urumqiensis]PMR80780.1 hypothetical protein C1H70_06845 [Halomonas urumqiensis]PTB02738.1 hypothetical protein C6V82_08845 [Halomonas urumqiensis]GHE21236.1 hypothetical protein GCM10017767_17570 [Halomonas urumqiensis]
MSVVRWMAISAMAVLSGLGFASDDGIQVTLEGDPGTPFEARWTIVTAEGEREVHEIEGQVPYRQRFTGEAFEGWLHHIGDQGHLTLEIIHKGNRSRSSTSARGSLSLSVK